MNARAPRRLRPRAPARIARALATAPLLLYRHVISPGLPRRCKYEPTCSRYAIEAIRDYGALRGVILAAWRVLRCNPWSYGGYDPVHAQRLFKRAPGSERVSEATN
jgi:putative membrane protein insertion efficiency factor